MKKFFPWGLLTLIALVFMAAFLLLPILNVISSSFYGADGEISLEGFRKFITEEVYLQALMNSLVLSTVVTCCTLLVGVPLAYVTVQYKLPLKAMLSILPIAVIVIPELITTQAWLYVFGYNGFVTKFLLNFGIQMPRFYGWFGLIFVMTLTYYVHIYMASLAALRSFDRELEEASRSLGNSPLKARLTLMIPLVAPAILSSALVVFTLVLGNFSVAIILGQGVPLLSVLTYNSFLSEIGNSPVMQSTLATISILILAIILVFQKQVIEKRRYEMVQGREIKAVKPKGWLKVLIMLGVCSVIFMSLVPFCLVLVGSVTKSIGPVMHWGQFTLDHFTRVWQFGLPVIGNSILYAGSATLCGVLIGVLTSYIMIKKKNSLTGFLDIVVMLPLAISGTVLGIALAQTFNSGFLVLSGTPVIMVLALMIRRLPFSVRNASTNLFNIPDSIENASISLGVPPVQSFAKVVVPLMTAGITSAAVIMWALTMAELNSSLIVYQAGQETLPIQIFRLIDSDLMGQASAYGVVMVSLILLPIITAVKVLKIKLFN